MLFNRTSRGGTDGAIWLCDRRPESGVIRSWAARTSRQMQDVNDDGWSDIPSYQRATGAAAAPLGRHGRPFGVLHCWRDVRGSRGRHHRGRASRRTGRRSQTLNTRRLDAGVVARFPWAPSRVFTFRSSGLLTSHDQRFGEILEHDRHDTWFGETALNGTAGRHTWVAGAALQQDGYRRQESPGLRLPLHGLRRSSRRTITRRSLADASASGRVDFHSEFGTFFSPRVSLLARAGASLVARLSAGTGFYPPTPFLDETEATSASSRLRPLGELEAERGRSVSFDMAGSTLAGADRHAVPIADRSTRCCCARTQMPPESPLRSSTPLGPGNTAGTELIAPPAPRPARPDRSRTCMCDASEPDPETGARRDLPFNPQSQRRDRFPLGDRGPGPYRRGSLLHGTAIAGRLAIPDDSLRYWLFGLIGEWRVGRHGSSSMPRTWPITGRPAFADRPAHASHRRKLARRRVGPADGVSSMPACACGSEHTGPA